MLKIVPIPELTQGRFLDALGEDAEMAYIIPRTDCYILGGTALANEWSKEPPSPAVARGILQRCNELAPGLAARAVVKSSHTDLRPVRSDSLALGRRAGLSDWIDVYGFGGSGWTMFLGASLHGTKLVSQMLSSKL